MDYSIEDNLGGLLFTDGSSEYNLTFRLQENTVTIIPLTDICRNHIQDLTRNDTQNNQWFFGICEDNTDIAFLRKSPLRTCFSSGINLSASKFFCPIIVKSTLSQKIDLKSFDTIEFYGGIIDILHIPKLAIDEKYSEKKIEFSNSEKYTKKHNVIIENVAFEIEYSIAANNLILETGKIPDLRNQIHSYLRFNFTKEQPLDNIEKYYSYAMNLIQFCCGRLNVNSEIRIYKKNISKPILVKINDGFDDYANEKIDFSQVIRFSFLESHFDSLFKILNESKTKPYLLFLTKCNKHIAAITYTDISDICASFEHEYSLSNTSSKKELIEAASNLTEKLCAMIESEQNCPEEVKKKAFNILNSNLKSFSPSLKEKIMAFYDEFYQYAVNITEDKEHIAFGIAKSYSRVDFEKSLSKFVAIRNKVAHSGIVWNDGIEIYPHLKLLIYFSILKRAGYSAQDSVSMLSSLFIRFF